MNTVINLLAKNRTAIQCLILMMGLNCMAYSQGSTSLKLDPNMALHKADVNGIIWFDAREDPFHLVGFEWIKHDHVYRRLPVHPNWEIRDAVDQLANNTAGGQVRFSTDSKRILVKVELSEKSGMYHMPATGQSGFDLYMLDGGVHKYLKTTRFSEDSIRYQVELFNDNQPLDAQFVNLGFSGNGRGEPALAHLMNQISNVGLIILDYEANASKTLVNSLEQFINILREKHPETPLLIMSKIRYARETEGSPMYGLLMSNRNFQEKIVNERKAAGDKNIYFLDGSTILGNDYYECTVDGVHPSDLGSKRIADALILAIKDILQ